jgi:hypothetical protein
VLVNILKRPRSDWTVAGAAARTKQTMMKMLLFVVKWFKMLERERRRVDTSGSKKNEERKRKSDTEAHSNVLL